MFARFQDIKQGKEFDAMNEPISHVEQSLNAVGIALRKDATHFKDYDEVIQEVASNWSKFNDLQKADISKSLAGTRQRENFITLVESFNQINDVQEKIAQSGEKAEEVFNSVYGESTEARITDIKQNIQLFWTETLNSNAINSFLDKINKVIEGLRVFRDMTTGAKIGMIALGATAFKIATNFITIGSAITKAKVAGESLTVLDGIIKTLIGTELTMKGVTTTLSATLSALFKTPAGLAFMGLAIAVGVATYAIIKHIQHQANLKQQTEALTNEYNNLTTAIQSNNAIQMKSSTDSLRKSQKDLQDLLEQRADLEKKLGDVNLDSASIMSYTQQLDKTNITIKEQIQALQDAGFQVDANTGEIINLSNAEILLANNNLAESIRNKAQAEFDNRKEIIALIQEYFNLESVEDKNAQQKVRLSELSEILSGKIAGLTVVRDSEGNKIIQNTGLLSTEINAFNQEGTTVATLSNAKLAFAKKDAVVEINRTKLTYEQVKQRMKYYMDEMKALQSLATSASGMNGKELAYTPQEKESRMGGLELVYGEYSSAYNTIESIYSNTSMGNVGMPDFGSPTSYTPSSGSSGSSKSSSPSSKSPSSKSPSSSSSKSSQTYTFNGAEVDEYQSQLQTVEDSLQKIDDKISEINQLKSNAESIDSESNYSEILKIQNQLLDEQINKQNTLNSKHDEVSELKNTIKEDIWKNWGKLRGKDLSKLTQTDWDDYLTQFYGKDRTFKNEADKKRYDVGLKKFQQLVKDYQDTTNKLNEIDDERLKQVEENNKLAIEVGQQQAEFVLLGYEKKIESTQNKISLLGSIDTEEEKLKNQQYLQEVFDVLAKESKFVEHEIAKSYKELETKTGAEALKIKEYIKQLEDEKIQIDIDFVKSEDDLESIAKEILQDAVNIEKENQEKLLAKRVYQVSKEKWSEYHEYSKKTLKEEIDSLTKEAELNKNNLTIQDLLVAKKKELSILDKETYENISDYQQSFEDIHNARIEAINAEIEALDKKNTEEEESEERQKRQLELDKLRQQLENARNQKNIQVLTKLSDGSYQFKYQADQSKIDDLTKQIKEKEEDNKKWEEELDIKKKKEALERERKYEEDLIASQKKSYDKQKIVLDSFYSDIDKIVETRMDALKDTYGNKWDEILKVLQDKLSQAKALQAELESQQLKNQNLNNSSGGYYVSNGTGYSPDGTTYDINGYVNDSAHQQLVNDFLDASERGDTQAMQDAQNKANDLLNNYAQFDTGGYTGSFDGGKLAVLHQKELILNADDTVNVLDTVKITRDMLKQLNNIQIPNFKLPSLDSLNLSKSTQGTQEYHYHFDKAEFPNVTDTSGVQNLFDNMKRLAIQYNPS